MCNKIQLDFCHRRRTYIYPADISSGRRYLYLLLAVLGGFLWWLGPVMGLFVADPMIQLMLLNSQVILPTSDCYNPLLPNQTCSTDVNVAYYFWNLTNEVEVRGRVNCICKANV